MIRSRTRLEAPRLAAVATTVTVLLATSLYGVSGAAAADDPSVPPAPKPPPPPPSSLTATTRT